MNKIFFAKLLSYIFNPLLFFLLMPYVVVYKETGDTMAAFRWSVFSAIFAISGLLLVLLGKRRGTFSDFDISNRVEREKFYLLLWPLLIIYLLAAFFIRGMFFSLSIIAVGIVIGLLLFEFVNHEIKASIHVGVCTSFILSVGILFGVQYFLLLCWIIPLLSWSRLVLHRHTPKEIFTGAALGVIITCITFLLAEFIL